MARTATTTPPRWKPLVRLFEDAAQRFLPLAARARGARDNAFWEEPPWIDDLVEASRGFPNRPHICHHSDALVHEMAH
eukprot:5617619-Pyramimonas_sp.AAC.1